LLTGADVFAASAFDSALGFFVGAVVSSSFFDSESVWAPPVLTTTPGGACVVVDPVDVDVTSVPVVVCSVVVAAVSLAASVESEPVVDESVDGASDDEVPGVSAHATPDPYPVTTAAPTPRATAKPPTRPTYAAAFMVLRIRQPTVATRVFAKDR